MFDENLRMKILYFLVYRCLAVILVVWVGCLFSGCEPAAIQPQVQSSKPVFYPGPPDKPRIQFLKSFSGSEYISAPKYSSLDRFLFGESEVKQQDRGIIKPYGVKIFEGKLYVCDVTTKMVAVIDVVNNTFGYLTKDRRLMNPVNIYIEDNGTKYVTDSTAGAIFVFDKANTLKAILGRELKIIPSDIVVRGQRCYITDVRSNQVVVMDKTTGKEITRIGKEGDGHGEFKLIAGIALDKQGNIYVTDKILGKITKFNNAGIFQQTIGGEVTTGIADFVRAKGISIDRQGRIWVVDAATEVAKIYNPEGRLLLYFGLRGHRPGRMILPAGISLDYDNIELFRKYAVEGAQIEFLVFVSNQYGPNKVNVYAFGRFPEQQPQQQPQQQQQEQQQEQK